MVLTKPTLISVNFRIPEDLLAQVDKLALEQNRSRNMQLIHLLREATK